MNYESTFSEEDSQILLDEDDRGKSRRNLILIAVAVLLAIGAVAAYFAFAGSDEAATAGAGGDDSQAPVVSIITPGTQTVSRTITATGTLAARREIPVGVVGEGGRVVAVYVDAGDWVRPGQIMASIDRSVQVQQIAALDASAQAARADLNLAQSNLDRAMQLVDRGFISKADIDRLTATRDAARARVNVARAQAAESRARTGRLNIVAPKGGYVLERNVEPGATVTQGSGILFRLAQSGEMELRAQVSESDLATLSTGMSAEVTPVGTSETLSGQVWQLSPMIESQSRQGIARIALGYDKSIRPGGFASARIESGSSVAPVLPESAVLSDREGSYVYIVGNDNKVARRKVTTGGVTAAGVTIADGLTGSEKVVLRAGGFLNPGETVRPLDPQARKTTEQG